MQKETEQLGGLLCAVAGPLLIREAEELCPAILQDGQHRKRSNLVEPLEWPDYPQLRAAVADEAVRSRLEQRLGELDAMRRERAEETGRCMDELVDFIPGYARCALLDKEPLRFNRLYDKVSHVMSKEWRRWMEHADFWNSVLGPRWLGQEDVPEGEARRELLVMVGLRYALLPQRHPDVLPENGLPGGLEIAVQMGRMQLQELQEPRNSPLEEELRCAALAMLQGEWEVALEFFRKALRTGNTAIYGVAENALAPLLVFAYLCAIRVRAKRPVIQTWGDILQSILPAFCVRGESEGMVGFLHNLTVLDGIMNRRAMPAYVPDTENDLACIPLALCYDRLSPQLRHKIGTDRIIRAIRNVMEQGQLLLGYYAASALSATVPLPEALDKRLRQLSGSGVAPLYMVTAPVEAKELAPAEALVKALSQGVDEEMEVLHWELHLDTATGTLRDLRPRLRATADPSLSHELTINQSAALCRESQDLVAVQLARLLEQGDASSLRWVSALAGHPRLRLAIGGRRTRAITLTAEKPVLRFQRDKGVLVVTLEAREDGVLRQVTDTEWAAQTHSDLLDILRELFRMRGLAGSITLPDAAADALFAHYDRLTRYFDVRGSLARVIDPVPGECRLVAAMGLVGKDREVRLSVRIHAKSATDMAPGEGAGHVDVKTPAGIVPVDRDLAQERAKADSVCRACGLEVHGGRYVWHPATHVEALDILARLEEAGVLLLREGEEFRCINVAQENLTFHARYMGGEWFEFGAELAVDEDLVYTLRELLLALEKKEGDFLPVRNGYLHVPPVLEGRLQALKVLTGNNGRNFGISTAALPALAKSTGLDCLPMVLRQRLETMGAASATPVPEGLQAQLRPYQLQGYRWLAERTAAGIGACLADDMGLGKTVQLIALLLQRAQEGPSLVVCPVSLQANWQQELERFAPGLRISTYHAAQPGRVPQAGEVVLCSYGQLVSNLKAFSATPWNVLALDEAQAIKNPDSQRAKAVCTLHAAARIALTGTPVENSSLDLWSIMRFLNPLLLGSKARFRRNFQTGATPYPLRDAVAPLILRRTKAEVLPQLPELTEQVRYVELSEPERAVYESARRNALQKLEAGGDRISVLAELTRLRRSCCHAGLVLPGYEGPASKLEGMLELVRSLQESGHKALVFSQFTDVLDLAEPMLELAGVDYERLDGQTTPRKRAAAVKRFQEGAATVFLISLKAGGTGLNLTAADYVLLLDPWWNPAVEAQAAGRSHRIGQDSPVTLYRLIAAQTVEERVLALHQEKRDLAEALLSASSQVSQEALHDLLRE